VRLKRIGAAEANLAKPRSVFPSHPVHQAGLSTRLIRQRARDVLLPRSPDDYGDSAGFKAGHPQYHRSSSRVSQAAHQTPSNIT